MTVSKPCNWFYISVDRWFNKIIIKKYDCYAHKITSNLK